MKKVKESRGLGLCPCHTTFPIISRGLSFFFLPFFLSSSFFFFQGPDVQMPVIAETARVLNELGFPKDETKKFSYLSEALFCAMYNNDILPEEAFIFWSEDHETEYVNFFWCPMT